MYNTNNKKFLNIFFLYTLDRYKTTNIRIIWSLKCNQDPLGSPVPGAFVLRYFLGICLPLCKRRESNFLDSLSLLEQVLGKCFSPWSLKIN